jgi:GTP pyrophosphokinase
VSDTVYPVGIFVLAGDRQGLLRDISEVFSREKLNVIGVNTQSAKGLARMTFTAEIASTAQLQKALAAIAEVPGVQEARRG